MRGITVLLFISFVSYGAEHHSGADSASTPSTSNAEKNESNKASKDDTKEKDLLSEMEGLIEAAADELDDKIKNLIDEGTEEEDLLKQVQKEIKDLDHNKDSDQEKAERLLAIESFLLDRIGSANDEFGVAHKQAPLGNSNGPVVQKFKFAGGVLGSSKAQKTPKEEGPPSESSKPFGKLNQTVVSFYAGSKKNTPQSIPLPQIKLSKPQPSDQTIQKAPTQTSVYVRPKKFPNSIRNNEGANFFENETKNPPNLTARDDSRRPSRLTSSVRQKVEAPLPVQQSEVEVPKPLSIIRPIATDSSRSPIVGELRKRMEFEFPKSTLKTNDFAGFTKEIENPETAPTSRPERAESSSIQKAITLPNTTLAWLENFKNVQTQEVRDPTIVGEVESTSDEADTFFDSIGEQSTDNSRIAYNPYREDGEPVVETITGPINRVVLSLDSEKTGNLPGPALSGEKEGAESSLSKALKWLEKPESKPTANALQDTL